MFSFFNFFFFLSLSKQHIYTVAFTYSLAPWLPRNLSGRPAGTARGHRSDAEEETRGPCSGEGRAAGRLRAGSSPSSAAAGMLRSAASGGQRPLQLGGSRGSGSQRGHPAPAPLNTAGQVRLFLIPSSSHKSTVCGRRAPAAARPAPEPPPIALPSRSLSFFLSLVSSSPRGENSTAGPLVLHFTARETPPPERLKQSEQPLSTLFPSLPAPSNAAG